MVTVVLKAKLDLPSVGSLKEKRRIVKSLIDRLKNKFNVSIAEVGDNDVLKSATIGAAVVSNENSFAHSVMSKLVDKINAQHDLVMIDYSIESY